MKKQTTYIRKVDFHASKDFLKIDRHINTSLRLIERLAKLNDECLKEVQEQLQVENYIIDYRIEQFKHIKETLSGICYSCYSLKYVYEISASMRLFRLDSTIGAALNNQMRNITFNSIIQMVATFEFTRKKFEHEIKAQKYLDAVKKKYPKVGESLQLLTNFRNTIHANGIWLKKESLEYKLRNGPITIKEGNPIIVEIWLLYRLLWDCIQLCKLMALDNKAAFYRETHLTNGTEKVVVLQLPPNAIDQIFKAATKSDPQ
ncbi:MAG: hypothetical protein KGM16_03080 [Bacteroidota bacterium]|nr:hypothetical protein [Bacteroidota bacterium]